MGVVGCLLERKDRGEAHVRPLHDLAPLRPGLLLEDAGDALLEGRPLGPVHLMGQFFPVEAGEAEKLGVELRFDGADRDVLAVGGLVSVVEVGAAIDDVGALLEVPEAHGPQAVDHGHENGGPVDHGGVDHLTLPGGLRFQEAADDAEGHEHAAAAEVAHHVDRRNGHLTGPAEMRQGAGQGDVVDVVPGHRGVRPLLAPAGHAAVDEAGVAGEAGVRPDPEPLGHAGPEWLDESVGALHEPEDEFHRIGVLEVDADRSAAPVEDVGRKGVEPPGAGRPFEADDFRPHVGQHHAGERAGADAGDLDDAVSLERSHARRGYLSMSCESPLGTSTR